MVTEKQQNQEKWEEKQLNKYFKWQTGESAYKKIWTWPRKGNLKSEIKTLLIEEQNNDIRTKYIKAKINNTQQNSKIISK